VDPVHSFTFILPSTASIVYFPQALFYFTANKHLFHTIRLILCFQQTSEIDNLTVSWGKVVWLCCVQVPHCCWRRGSLVNHAPDYFLAPCQSKLATTFRSGFFLLLSIKLWFHTEGKLTVVLIIPSSWGFPTGPLRHQDCFLAPLPGRKRISVRGVSHFQSLYFVIVLLSFFTLFCLLLVYQKHKKIVPFTKMHNVLVLHFDV
jgi:hypothetical protein